uniref:Uncharacterized protein n=1 Tax=Avena sativa TaxID=4498 RepID=A0ACD5U2H8_AVESA
MAPADNNGNYADDASGDDPMETAEPLGDTAAGDLQFSEDDGHGESTECSSSFGPSCSGSDDGGTKLGLHDMEVDSPFFGHINEDGSASVPKTARQKHVTDEWRKAVRPLMWRCQWLELRMKDLSSQVAKYDKELALIQHEKDLQLEMLQADSSNPELAKLDVQSHDRNTMKRRKRQRHEDMMDTSLYMNNHPILSHYYENKNSGADGPFIHDDFNNAVVDPDNTLPEAKETDRVFEQYSLRDILLTIDGLQSRVISLQDHLSKVCSNHAQDKVPQKSQKDRTQLTSCMKDGQRPQKKRDLHTLLQEEDKYRPLVGVPSTLSDRSTDNVTGYAKKVTFETIFGADNPLIRTHVRELCKQNADDVLIYNQAAQVEGYQQFEKVKQEAENRRELVNKVANSVLSRREETIARQVVKHEPVHEIAPTVKQVSPGNNLGKKSKKKLVRSLPPSKDQTGKSPDVPAKNRTENDLHSVKDEKLVFVAVDTRRSKRVRKPKKYSD